jgi:similar to stage IV sporulation protein
VQGNSQVSDIQILDAAERAGIKFGTLRRSIRSEQIKNQLLDMLPQLQWVGITTEGCVATISVREIHPDPNARLAPLCGIVAARDGVIQNMHITKGNALCVPGQAVKAGELLVSAYTDCGLNLRANGAEGEIYALTVRENKTALPAPYCVQGEKSGEILRCSLIVGKKRINFYKDSGICDTGCDKMYKEYYVSLPNGVQLPFGLGVEQNVVYEDLTNVSDFAQITALQEAARSYLVDQMVSGEVRGASETIETKDGLMQISGVYICHELIGREELEDVLQYGENN